MLEEESQFWVGVLGEEVYVGSIMVGIGISRGYFLVCWEAMKLEGNSKDLFEVAVKYLNSCKGAWFGLVGFFFSTMLIVHKLYQKDKEKLEKVSWVKQEKLSFTLCINSTTYFNV